MPQDPASHVAKIVLPFAKIRVLELAQAFNKLVDHIIERLLDVHQFPAHALLDFRGNIVHQPRMHGEQIRRVGSARIAPRGLLGSIQFTVGLLHRVVKPSIFRSDFGMRYAATRNFEPAFDFVGVNDCGPFRVAGRDRDTFQWWHAVFPTSGAPNDLEAVRADRALECDRGTVKMSGVSLPSDRSSISSGAILTTQERRPPPRPPNPSRLSRGLASERGGRRPFDSKSFRASIAACAPGLAAHLHEAEALAAGRVTLQDDLGAPDRPIIGEQLLRRGVVDLVTEVAYVRGWVENRRDGMPTSSRACSQPLGPPGQAQAYVALPPGIDPILDTDLRTGATDRAVR
jgi:hypothetical protein